MSTASQAWGSSNIDQKGCRWKLCRLWTHGGHVKGDGRPLYELDRKEKPNEQWKRHSIGQDHLLNTDIY